ncbi:MAG: hypothetical protein WD048_10005 [Chitinophagales bacterium]
MKNIIFIPIILFLIHQSVFAQEPTRRPQIEFEHGDLVSSNTGRIADGILSKASKAYSEFFAGVYNEASGISNIPSILTSGIVYIKFDSSEGHVSYGDYVTTSNEKGFGMKASRLGFIIGIALEDSNNTSGLLKIRLEPCWVEK